MWVYQYFFAETDCLAKYFKLDEKLLIAERDPNPTRCIDQK